MKRIYAILAAFALLTGVAVMTASAAYPTGQVAQPSQAVTNTVQAPQPGTRSRNHVMLNRLTVGEPLMNGVAQAPGPDMPPAFGTDVRISTDNAGRPHNEHFGAADPLNVLHFTTGANDYGTTSYSGFWYTLDGGVTWAGGAAPGPYPGGTGILPQGDPMGDIDAMNNTYFGDLGFSNSNDCLGGIYSHRSTNNGATYDNVEVAASDSTHFLDKPWMAANKQTTGPYAGWVYVGYANFVIGSGCDFSGFDSVAVMLKRSSDHGATWSSAMQVPQPTNPFAASSGTDIAVGSDGVVYVAYNFWTDPTQNDQRNDITRSTDGGQTFGTYYGSTSGVLDFIGYFDNTGYQFLKADNAGHGFRVNQNPSIAVDPANSNNVYMVWSHHQSGWDTTYSAACCGGSTGSHTFLASDIAFARSTNAGQTWSAPMRVNDDALNNAKDQFYPWMTTSPDGTIHVMWMDRRDSADNTLYHIYYSQSTDHGVTWSANQRVSDQPSNPAGVLFSDNNGFIGDYNGIAANNTRVLPFWADVRAGTPANEQRLYTDVGLFPTPTNTPTRTVTPTPCATCPTPTPTQCSPSFSDVPPGSTFYDFVRCVYCRGAIGGYPDGTFRPGNPATRGQMTKILVLAFGLTINDNPPALFSDVPVGSTFFSYVQTAARADIVGGYPDGTFRPGNNVTRGQLSKIIVNGAVIVNGWTLINPPTASFSDVPVGSAFYTYVETAVCHQIIGGYPDGTFRPGATATRGQISKIVCLAAQNQGTCNPPGPTPTPVVSAVSIQDFTFQPGTVTVSRGTTVTWTNMDSATHTATSDTAVWDSGNLTQNQTYSFTFNTAGSYPYHCAIHSSMVGTIVVNP